MLDIELDGPESQGVVVAQLFHLFIEMLSSVSICLSVASCSIIIMSFMEISLIMLQFEEESRYSVFILLIDFLIEFPPSQFGWDCRLPFLDLEGELLIHQLREQFCRLFGSLG